MTRDEFIAGYCARSEVEPEWLMQRMQAVPCACGAYGCEGWAMLPNDIADDPRALALATRIWPD